MTPGRLLNAGSEEEAANWLMVHRTYDSHRISPLDEISAETVGDPSLGILTCGQLAAKAGPQDGGRVIRLVADVISARRVQIEANPDLLLQGTASELRAPVRFGAFVSETIYKLGLLGMVIGFIIMLVSMRDLGEFDVETMREALQSMTGGMALSLLTTIARLVCGVLQRLQVNILDQLALRIVHGLVRLTDVLMPAALAAERRGGV